MTGAINIEFLQDGGVPLTNDLMSELMNAISLYNILGELAGNLTIISGCVVTGNTVSNGVVYINGDILPFQGGYISETVIVEETIIEKTFENLQDKGLVYKKVAKFGLGEPEYDWSEFKTVSSLKQLAEDLESKASKSVVDQLILDVNLLKLKTAPIINGGIVFPFRRPVDEIPVGWKECTDFRGKTIVGYDPNDNDFKNLNTDYGEKTTKLTPGQLPKMEGKFETLTGNSVVPSGIVSWLYSTAALIAGGSTNFSHKGVKIAFGNDESHNNVQPSRIALYIEPNFQPQSN